jgi:hypothetical protein
MKHGVDGTDFEQTEGTVADGVASLREGEGVILPDALHARVAGRLSCFDAAKECLKRKVNALDDILKRLGVNFPQFGMRLFPNG